MYFSSYKIICLVFYLVFLPQFTEETVLKCAYDYVHNEHYNSHGASFSLFYQDEELIHDMKHQFMKCLYHHDVDGEVDCNVHGRFLVYNGKFFL